MLTASLRSIAAVIAAVIFPDFSRQGDELLGLWAKFDHSASYGKRTQQIKHETGHVQFRMLRENATGQNSLHLSGSTPARGSGIGPVSACENLERTRIRYAEPMIWFAKIKANKMTSFLQLGRRSIRRRIKIDRDILTANRTA